VLNLWSDQLMLDSCLSVTHINERRMKKGVAKLLKMYQLQIIHLTLQNFCVERPLT
jgi:hypothetical protein